MTDPNTAYIEVILLLGIENMIGKKFVLTAMTCLLFSYPYLSVSKNPDLFA